MQTMPKTNAAATKAASTVKLTPNPKASTPMALLDA